MTMHEQERWNKRKAENAHLVGKRFVHKKTGEAVMVTCIYRDVEYGLCAHVGGYAIQLGDLNGNWEEQVSE